MEFLRLREVIKEKGVTGKDIAARVGITENALSLIANGKRQPRFELLSQIAQALDVDIKDLFVSTKEAEELTTLYVKHGPNLVEVGAVDVKKMEGK